MVKDEIKDRAIYVYVPSAELKEKWRQLAEENGQSISSFIVQQVKENLDEEPGDYESRAELTEKVDELKEEVNDLRKRRREQRKLIDRLEEELRRYRAKPFLEGEFEGIREYNEELVEIIRERNRPIGQDELLDCLGINPAKESEVVQAISKQLDLLKEFGLVKSGARGWSWNR